MDFQHRYVSIQENVLLMHLMKSLVCVYCGQLTTENEDLEHLAPEALGCRETLYRGAVCTICNRSLGAKVDAKIFNEPLMALGQIVSGTKGKRGTRRKINSGKGVVQTTSTGVSMKGTTSGTQNEYFISRALAKIAVNTIVHATNSQFVRDHYPELINHVRSPKSRKAIWPFFAYYSPIGRNSNGGLELMTPPEPQNPAKFCFAWHVCSSGVFAIPLDRNSKKAIAEATKFVKNLVSVQIEQGWEPIMSAEYTAENKNF